MFLSCPRRMLPRLFWITWRRLSLPDADRLRGFLRQKLELGEREITLDTLRIERGSTAPRAEAERETRATDTDWRAALAGTSVVAASVETDIFSAPAQFASLAEIASAVAACRACALHQTALNPVPGEGNPNAELVCVGEGPGATEDETGRPFVGQAGKLLTDILLAINLRREDVFICNVVKHRPPGNRAPLPEEVAACQPFLVRQLELVKPRVILALGASAAQTLLRTKLAIGKLRGVVHRYNDTPLIVTYHPAALLRNPAWKRPTWEDVKLVRRLLDEPAGR
jgi:DNA polymerase